MSSLPKFTPSMVDHRYQVTLLRNRYDTDEGRFTDTVTAIGPYGAQLTAEDKWREEYPDCVAVHVEEVVVDPDFCESCGYDWSIHRNDTLNSVGPFGCPPDEQTARLRWGS